MGWLHYLAPRVKGDDLGPPWTYVWGLGLGILPYFALWLGLSTVIDYPLTAISILVALLLVVAGAGAGTLLSYLADWSHGQRV
jgi:hypothetical protein